MQLQRLYVDGAHQLSTAHLLILRELCSEHGSSYTFASDPAQASALTNMRSQAGLARTTCCPLIGLVGAQLMFSVMRFMACSISSDQHVCAASNQHGGVHGPTRSRCEQHQPLPCCISTHLEKALLSECRGWSLQFVSTPWATRLLWATTRRCLWSSSSWRAAAHRRILWRCATGWCASHVTASSGLRRKTVAS